MTKTQQTVEHIVVTFFEAGIAYLAINQTNLSGNAKLTAIGALGAGLSAVYNILRQSTPTLVEPTVATVVPMNGVNQLTASNVVTPEIPIEIPPETPVV